MKLRKKVTPKIMMILKENGLLAQDGKQFTQAMLDVATDVERLKSVVGCMYEDVKWNEIEEVDLGYVRDGVRHFLQEYLVNFSDSQ